MKKLSNLILFTICVIVYLIVVITIGVILILAIMLIGKLIGINNEIFVYVCTFLAMWKAHDIVSWALNKRIDKWEHKKEEEYFKRFKKE